ncbi:MAG: cysteine methyltransferase [Rickettsiaceae bacterium]|jgi:methylated-DNA-[protein]-cysteine S-methyltransferase|nr:cysteine methyltransferase [Rickettsiaceae bacterium]
MKNFNQKCYDLLMQIPEGKVTTYGELAKAAGNEKASRAVGNAMNKNPNAPEVPCHRVVGGNGTLTGYAFGLDKKAAILKQEGVEVKDNKVNLEKYLYRF